MKIPDRPMLRFRDLEKVEGVPNEISHGNHMYS